MAPKDRNCSVCNVTHTSKWYSYSITARRNVVIYAQIDQKSQNGVKYLNLEDHQLIQA